MPMATKARVDTHLGNLVSGAHESPAYLNLMQMRGRLSEMLNRSSARVGKLGQLAAGLATIDAAYLPLRGAGYGSCVVVEDSQFGGRDEYTLMVGSLVDLEANQVSMASPLGQALLGSVAGDEVSFQTPQRRVSLRVISVRTLSDLLDADGRLD